MSYLPVTLLYEDQRTPVQEFALHKLVMMLVYDQIDGADRYALMNAAMCIPKKGVEKVLRACRDDLAELAVDGRAVIAVLDADRIREKLGLSSKASDAEVEAAINIRGDPHLRVVLLDRNTESVLVAIGECDASLEKDLLAKAIAKSLNERDLVLRKASRDGGDAVRTCLLERVPSLVVLRDSVISALGRETA